MTEKPIEDAEGNATHSASPATRAPVQPAVPDMAHAEPVLDALPDSLLESIFERLDVHTLLQRVALVSRRFRRVAESQTLWLARLPHELSAILRSQEASSSGSPSSTLVTSYPRFYCSLASANLLHNPWFCLDEQMSARRSLGGDIPGKAKTPWQVPAGSNAWSWGAPAEEGLVVPEGQPRLPPRPLPPYTRQGPPRQRQPGVVASSYNWNAVLQEVDLVDELCLRGLSTAAASIFLDACPTLVFEVYVAGRFDCQGWCEISIILDGRPHSPPLERLGFERWMVGAAAIEALPRHDAEANVWQRKELRVQASCPGVRRAVVWLVGSERRFWAGAYGAKFASPTLRFAM